MIPAPYQGLGRYRQFINWRREWNGKKSKFDKYPWSVRTHQRVSVTERSNYIDYAEALAGANGDDIGIGFVFTADDPFWFVDIDGCNEGGRWSNVATSILRTFPGAAVEVSMSGNGLHIIGSGQAPAHRCKNALHGLEFYTSDRFVALSFNGLMGDCTTDHSAALPAFIATYLDPGQAGGGYEWTDGPDPQWNGIKDDEQLIAKALKQRSVESTFNGRATFKNLWCAEVEALAKTYPSSGGSCEYDESMADGALAQHLAFWTGNDCERILRLMGQSALVRDKWGRPDYLPRTILGACARQHKFYGESAIKGPVEAVKTTTERRFGYQFVTPEMQIEMFKGCVYIQESNKVLTKDGIFLDQPRFNATYGGYVFALDDMNDKITKLAWEAFTQSQTITHPIAQVTCFRPEEPPTAIVMIEGRPCANAYVPPIVERRSGDASPFWNHLRKVLPDERDQRILMSFMAACVQYKGVKFQWAPLLQGAEGNGKTLFSRCVSKALSEKYTHSPKATEIDEKFNDWLFHKLFIAVEDIYVPESKSLVIEAIKPMITNDRLAMRAMREGQVMGDNRANFMLNSNHRDAVRKTRDDRRFSIFYTAQQSKADIERDGMTGEYFPRLYDWLKYEDGYAIVTDLLHTYPIDVEFNPAGLCQRAPDTSTTHQAIETGMGTVEHEILEAVAQDRPGFKGGWVSSIALDNMLKAKHIDNRAPLSRRKDIMERIGYLYHPALVDGRVNNPVSIDDGKKPRLFIHKDSPKLAFLRTPVEVAADYVRSQSESV